MLNNLDLYSILKPHIFLCSNPYIEVLFFILILQKKLFYLFRMQLEPLTIDYLSVIIFIVNIYLNIHFILAGIKHSDYLHKKR